MEEEHEKKEELVKNEEPEKVEREEIFSKAVRAGKRTYFFDVKATRRNDLYLTITESKKRFNRDGRFYYEKHKIFLYKEDFDKFSEGLSEVVDFIKSSKSEPVENEEIKKPETQADEKLVEDYTDVKFEDLEKKKEK
jgi:hypothetical protein